jgi:urease accessory protein
MLPIGSFSFSGALESAVQEGFVTDPTTLRSFTRTATRRSAHSDGIAVLAAHRAARTTVPIERITEVDLAVVARKLSEETRIQSLRTGKKLVEVAAAVLGSALVKEWLEQIALGATPGTYPVGLGVVCAELGLGEQESFAMHQHGVAMTVLNAALRLMRVDHLTTQALLYEINAHAEADYAAVADATIADMSGFAPLTDILGAVHARSHVRMFMT